MIEADPVYSRRSDMLLRVFFLDQVSGAEARDMLNRVGRSAASDREALEATRTRIEESKNPLALNGRLALEYGLRLATLQESWAQWAADQVVDSTVIE